MGLGSLFPSCYLARPTSFVMHLYAANHVWHKLSLYYQLNTYYYFNKYLKYQSFPELRELIAT